MLLSKLLQKNGVKITPPIQALIDIFGNPQISCDDNKDFVERIESLCGTNLFGVYDFNIGDDSTNIWDLGRRSYNKYEYATLNFAKKFPKFERLFVEIWILMNPGKLSLYYDQEDRFNHYYYQHRTKSVEITINDDSVKIVIPNLVEIMISHMVCIQVM
jgi:hypothetical protein